MNQENPNDTAPYVFSHNASDGIDRVVTIVEVPDDFLPVWHDGLWDEGGEG